MRPLLLLFVLLGVWACAVSATVEFYDNPRCSGTPLSVKLYFLVDGAIVPSRCDESSTSTTRTVLSKVCFDADGGYCVGAELLGPNGACLPVAYVFRNAGDVYKVDDATGLWATQLTCEQIDSNYRHALRLVEDE